MSQSQKSVPLEPEKFVPRLPDISRCRENDSVARSAQRLHTFTGARNFRDTGVKVGMVKVLKDLHTTCGFHSRCHVPGSQRVKGQRVVIVDIVTAEPLSVQITDDSVEVTEYDHLDVTLTLPKTHTVAPLRASVKMYS